MRFLIIGYGNVGREFGALLAEKMPVLRRDEQIDPTIVGVITGRHGGWRSLDPAGIAPAALLASGWPASENLPDGTTAFAGDALTLIEQTPADVVIELSPTDPRTGEPATTYIRAAFARGSHVITANKGPIAVHYHDLAREAEAAGVQLRFESTVIDGTPIINLAQFTLPATEILGVRAIINGTSNYILSALGAGQDFAATLAEAQAVGIAETDPSLDLDGWDASVKLVIIANVLMGAHLTVADITRDSNAEKMQTMTASAPAGTVVKQVAMLRRDADAPTGVQASVALQALTPDDPLAGIGKGKAAIVFQTDTLGDLTIIEGPGTPRQTAFGVLADLITIVRQTRHS